mgnify:FL=1
MSVKLTLSISDEETVAKMKEYASEHDTSLSSLVEEHFENILTSTKRKRKISPLVQSLRGCIKLSEEDMKRDYRDIITEEIMKKQSKHIKK